MTYFDERTKISDEWHLYFDERLVKRMLIAYYCIIV